MTQTEDEIAAQLLQIPPGGRARHPRHQHRTERDGEDSDRQVDDPVDVGQRRNRLRPEPDGQRAVHQKADLKRRAADHARQHQFPELFQDRPVGEALPAEQWEASVPPEQNQHESELNRAGEQHQSGERGEKLRQPLRRNRQKPRGGKSADQKEVQQQRPERRQHKNPPGVEHRSHHPDQTDEEGVGHQNRQQRERQLDPFGAEHREPFRDGRHTRQVAQSDRAPGDQHHDQREDSAQHRKDHREIAPHLLRTRIVLRLGHQRNQRRSQRPLAEQTPEEIRNREGEKPGAGDTAAAQHPRLEHDPDETEHPAEQRGERNAERAL